jgi:glutaryl-CoA dehydrogenase
MSQPAQMREGKPAMLKDKDFQWEDPLDLEGELSEEERMVRDTARGFAQDYLMPRVIAAYRDETYDPNMLPEMGFSDRRSRKNTAAPASVMSATG